MLFAHREKYHKGRAFAHFRFHLYEAVLQVHQFFHQVQADTCTRFVQAGVYLVLRRETLKQQAALVLWNTNTRICHRHHDVVLALTETNSDTAAFVSVFECIGKQVIHYRVRHVAVKPNCRILQLILNRKTDMFVVSLLVEIRTRVGHQLLQVEPLNLHLHLMILNLPEVQNLVYHTQHTRRVGVHYLQLTPNSRRDFLVLQDVLHRPRNKGQRCTQLVRYIGEETQFYLRHFLLDRHFLTQTCDDNHRLIQRKCDDCKDKSVKQECPTRQPKRRTNVNLQRAFVVHPHTFGIGRTDTESVVAAIKFRISGTTQRSHVVPSRINAIHLVGILHLVVLARERQSRVFDGKYRLRVVESNLRSINDSIPKRTVL